MHLPGRFRNAWNFSAQSQLAETEAADPELSEESPWTSTHLAPVVLARRELLRLARDASLLQLAVNLCVLYSFCCGSHLVLLQPVSPAQAGWKSKP